MMKYLVTGGAGFIGSHIARALLERGNQVRILDNFSSGKRENLKGLNVDLLEGDLRDASKVADAVKGVDIIFHEAAFVSVAESMEKPQECFDVNMTGTSILFDAARKAGVRRVVIASSAAVYGDSEIYPLSEDTPLTPVITVCRIQTRRRNVRGIIHPLSSVWKLSHCVISTSTAHASDLIPCTPPPCRSSSAACWTTNRLPSMVMADKPATSSTSVTWCRQIYSHPNIPPRLAKFSTSAQVLKLVYLTCSTSFTKYSRTHPNMSTPSRAQVTSIVPSARRKRSMETLGFKPNVSLADGLKEAVEEMRGCER